MLPNLSTLSPHIRKNIDLIRLTYKNLLPKKATGFFVVIPEINQL